MVLSRVQSDPVGAVVLWLAVVGVVACPMLVTYVAWSQGPHQPQLESAVVPAWHQPHSAGPAPATRIGQGRTREQCTMHGNTEHRRPPQQHPTPPNRQCALPRLAATDSDRHRHRHRRRPRPADAPTSRCAVPSPTRSARQNSFRDAIAHPHTAIQWPQNHPPGATKRVRRVAADPAQAVALILAHARRPARDVRAHTRRGSCDGRKHPKTRR